MASESKTLTREEFVAEFESSSSVFSNPAAIRDLPDVVVRSLPDRSVMNSSAINRALLFDRDSRRGIGDSGRTADHKQ
jgi:hypothetical protein